MKRVLKSQAEPPSLTEYKQRFQKAPANWTWVQFKKQDARREGVKTQLRADQRGLCAYCENALIPQDESVEHFVARDTDHALELDWTNLLLCCSGGERPLSEEVADGATRYDPNGPKTCGHAKLASAAAILNPLSLPAVPRLVRYKSESGEILPDEALCQQFGINPQVVALTISTLGLQASRLNKARRAILSALMDMLGDPAAANAPFSLEREQQLAAEQVPSSGLLPGFFTTIRYTLGQGAEAHLEAIGFQG